MELLEIFDCALNFIEFKILSKGLKYRSNYIHYILIHFFFFTLYPAHSRIGRGILMLKYSVPYQHYSRRICQALCVEWWNSKRRCAPTSQRRNENIKYLISSIGNWTHNLAFTVTHLCSCATTETSEIKHLEKVILALLPHFP